MTAAVIAAVQQLLDYQMICGRVWLVASPERQSVIGNSLISSGMLFQITDPAPEKKTSLGFNHLRIHLTFKASHCPSYPLLSLRAQTLRSIIPLDLR